MSELSDTVYFKVLKRVARRYTEQMKNKSFTLKEEDPNFAVRHTRFVEQAVGMNLMIKIIEGAGKELRKEDAND